MTDKTDTELLVLWERNEAGRAHEYVGFFDQELLAAVPRLIAENRNNAENLSRVQDHLKHMADEKRALEARIEKLRDGGTRLIATLAGLEQMFESETERAEFTKLWREFVSIVAADNAAANGPLCTCGFRLREHRNYTGAKQCGTDCSVFVDAAARKP